MSSELEKMEGDQKLSYSSPCATTKKEKILAQCQNQLKYSQNRHDNI